MDLIAALVLIMLSMPVQFILLLTGALAFKGKPLYSQRRTGWKGKPFTLWKFRSMNERKSADGKLLQDADRLPRYGRWLRKTSLDELPQLWLVLWGHMSLVGPRPLLPEYMPLYSAEQNRRHELRPGLTGWTQVNGRNAKTWTEKFQLDLWYVDHCSFLLDLQIMAKTPRRLIKASGVSAPGQATAPYFNGKN